MKKRRTSIKHDPSSWLTLPVPTLSNICYLASDSADFYREASFVCTLFRQAILKAETMTADMDVKSKSILWSNITNQFFETNKISSTLELDQHDDLLKNLIKTSLHDEHKKRWLIWGDGFVGQGNHGMIFDVSSVSQPQVKTKVAKVIPIAFSDSWLMEMVYSIAMGEKKIGPKVHDFFLFKKDQDTGILSWFKFHSSSASLEQDTMMLESKLKRFGNVDFLFIIMDKVAGTTLVQFMDRHLQLPDERVMKSIQNKFHLLNHEMKLHWYDAHAGNIMFQSSSASGEEQIIITFIDFQQMQFESNPEQYKWLELSWKEYVKTLRDKQNIRQVVKSE